MWRVIIIAILILTVIFIPIAHSEKTNEEIYGPLIAHKARKIPDIDGVLSPSEWGDAKPYLFQWEKSPITNGKLYMTFCLKHLNNTLYILFIINDNDTDKKDSLDITLSRFLIIYPNGTGYEGWLSRCGPVPSSTKIDGKAAVTYKGGKYIFEVSLNMSRYLNLSNDMVAPFNIGYSDGNTLFLQWISIGPSLEDPIPGIKISSDYYTGKETIYDVVQSVYENNPFDIITVVAVICVSATVIGIIVWMFKKKIRESLREE